MRRRLAGTRVPARRAASTELDDASRPSTSACSARRVPAPRARWSARPGVGKSRLLRELERGLAACPTRPTSTRAAACRTAADRLLGARRGDPRRLGIVDSDSADAGRGRSSRPSRALFRPARRSRPRWPRRGGRLRKTALLGRLVGLEVPARARRRRAKTPSGCASGSSPARAPRHGGLVVPEAARVRLRGHPLGRRRHARRDRAPRAMGARPAAASSAWPATSCSTGGRAGAEAGRREPS